MINEFLPTIIFFLIIFSFLFWVFYLGRTIDRKIQNRLRNVFSNTEIIQFSNIEKSTVYLKKIGSGIFLSRKFFLYTNNKEAHLNRQVIFEFEMSKKNSIPFVLVRYPNSINFSSKADAKKETEAWKKNLFVFGIPFSEFYQLKNKIQIASESLRQNNKDRIFSLIENGNLQEKFEKIPVSLKILGFNANNSSWKIYCENEKIGFEIDSTWLKKISFTEIENFLRIVTSLAEVIEKN
ncbi:MAG: hypothetical protein L6Q54_14640 [Leptospiraceae bacterium]|nr:hypothetical protein [Leptospiraceae bacterium]MCK6382471.1 hypothetical protein [Leptospiraceae bacterium]NUM40936.1 hypothetical protein [Leptospiraceae bacterium]